MGLIYQIDIAWPNLWDTLMGWISISTLLSSFSLYSSSSRHSLLDSRAHFLLITILLPLSLSFIMLIYAKPFYTIVWVFTLLLGLGLLAAGVALILLNIGDDNNRNLLAGIGAACIIVCLLIYLIRFCVKRGKWKKKVENLKNAMRKKREEKEMELAREAEERDKEERDKEDRNSTSSTEGSVNDSPVPSRSLIKPLISPALRHHPPALRLQQSDSKTSEVNITNRVLDQEKEEEKEAFENAQNYKEIHYKGKGKNNPF